MACPESVVRTFVHPRETADTAIGADCRKYVATAGEYLVRVCLMAYIKDNLLCKGEASILIKNIENGNLRMILEDLRKKHKGKGTIIFGDGDYCSFSPKVE